MQSKIKRKWGNVARLIREKRELVGISQSELSRKLTSRGHIIGPQLVSNVERNLCNWPLKHFKDSCELLNIDPEDFKIAYLKDLKCTIEGLYE